MFRKKITLLIFSILGIVVLGCGLLYFVIIYRFKESVKYMVSKETKGRYVFDAGTAKLSLWSKTLVLEKSTLFSQDTSKTNSYYNVTISRLKFSLASWNDLIFNKKVVVDSLQIIDPDIEVHAQRHAQSKSKTAFHPSDILTFLEKTQQYFNLSNLSLKNASFSYNQKDQKPIRISDVNLSIRNFVKVNNDDSHLFGSDQIVLCVGKQDLVLPDHKLAISFSSLKFNSENQLFNIDSLVLYQEDGSHKGRMKFNADRFTFNSKHLPAIYQKDQLLLDTVTCVNPVLTLFKNTKDTAVNSSHKAENKSALFKLINIKLINIVNGALMQNGRNGEMKNSLSKSANLNIYNLSVHADKQPKIAVDSVRMDLRDMTFLSKDSLHKLNIAEFSFAKNNVIFHQVRYSPTSLHKTQKSMVFSAPAMILKNVNLEALLLKTLHADQAELLNPVIMLDDKSHQPTVKIKPKSSAREGQMMVFYQTLHQFKQMINVKQLLIRDGRIHYKASPKLPLTLDAWNLNANILLNKAFVSDSLVDIKHAIPELRIGRLDLKTKGLVLSLRDYKFNGALRQNWARKLDLNLRKNKIIGEHIYWKVFDWDVYHNTKAIQIDSLYLGKLIVDQRSDKAAAPAQHKKNLPVIRLAKLNINEISFNSQSPTTQMGFVANNFYADHIKSVQHYFTWDKIRTNVSNFKLAGPNTTASIQKISLNHNKGHVENAVFVSDAEKGYKRISLPSLRFNGKLQSSNFDTLDIASISADGAIIDVHAKLADKQLIAKQSNTTSGNAKQGRAQTSGKHQNFRIGTADISNATFRFTKAGEKDTLKFSSQLSLTAKNIHSLKKDGYVLGYDDIQLHLMNGKYDHQSAGATIPRSSLQLSKGRLMKNKDHKLSLSSAIGFNWKDVAFQSQKDSTILIAKGISGAFNDPNFLLDMSKKADLNTLILKTNIEGKEIEYKSKNTQANAGNYSWDPVKNKLSIRNFNVQPGLSQDLFFKTSKWQGDYITVKGDSLSLAGIKLKGPAPDSILSVGKINLYGIALSASRDKHLPGKPGHWKPMPTQLINSIKTPFNVDEIALHHSSVVYHELEAKSNQWSEIPFTELNGSILNVSNRKYKDSLELDVSGRLFSTYIRRFSYHESYADSLAGFNAKADFSAMDLREFTKMSMPMGSVGIISGQADTLYSSWSGNKYAALGRMNFSYDALKLKFFPATHQSHFMPAVKTFVVNLILPNSRHQTSVIYLERNQQKFIFNYWIKAQLSGLLSTFGLKSSKKYLKLYQKKSKQFKLPDLNEVK